MKTLLSIHYFPCVQWFSKLVHQKGIIEQYENYSKGSYRNRCHIIGANGIQRLSIPLIKGKNNKMPIQEVQISYSDHWQKEHWQSIRSAYGNAPFFNFYDETIRELIFNQEKFLLNYNLKIINTLLELFGLDESYVNFTNSFEKESSFFDLRNGISPKENKIVSDPYFKNIEYAQVFLEKHQFIKNMSVLDLLFCTGPQAIEILENSYQINY